MLMTILNLFGKSPFVPLETHMEEVSNCVYMLIDLFEALLEKKFDKLEEILQKMSKQEHAADLTKNDIRNHLPKNIYLPIDRRDLLDILSIQDSIADRAEDIAVMTTLKQIEMPNAIKEDFQLFLEKTIETFNGARRIIKELHDLLESSFGGVEAEKVRKMVNDVARKEHETDLIQHRMVKSLLNSENEMSYTTFFLWEKIFEALASISNLSENLAYKVRMTLEYK